MGCPNPGLDSFCFALLLSFLLMMVFSVVSVFVEDAEFLAPRKCFNKDTNARIFIWVYVIIGAGK